MQQLSDIHNLDFVIRFRAIVFLPMGGGGRYEPLNEREGVAMTLQPKLDIMQSYAVPISSVERYIYSDIYRETEPSK